ncbi:LicD family protein [bacterium]|nr:LicD family protein [bacterium]
METWKKYYTKEQLDLLQKIELENLRVFIEVCNKLNLEYFVYGGTLLGVEKYQGMIPWDDDIDVAMPRESYKKFLKYATDVLPDEYFIQSPDNCPKSPYPYIKLRRKGTKFIEYVNRNLDVETGIYIDIYPVDRIPDDEELRKQQFKNARKWIMIYVIRQSRLYDKKEAGIKGFVRTLGKRFVTYFLKIFPAQYCLKKIDYYMTLYNDTETQRYAALNSPNYDNIYLHLFPLQKGVFNGIEVNIPGDHKTHLKMRYGDYSGLPPEEKRCGHVPYILDLGENRTEGEHK